ncbi:hypothetical protein LUZ60_000620 [Juncus effusus]|nr:hypothetical protein LUZ60_000620 [Juncus effusus]
MDSSLKQLSLSLLGLLALSSLFTTTNGSGRFFFSKILRSEPPSIPTNLPLKSQSGHGYGLYGRPEQFEFEPTTTTTTVRDEQNIPLNLPDEKPKPMNENYANQYNKEQLESTNNSPSEFSNEFTEGRYESKNNYNYDQKRRDWQYQHKYGMSDTRFMDNGRYYYNVNSKRYGYPFESNSVRTNSEEYGLNGGGGRKGRDGNAAYGYANENEYNNNGLNEYIP